jgi:hypothetical protein
MRPDKEQSTNTVTAGVSAAFFLVACCGDGGPPAAAAGDTFFFVLRVVVAARWSRASTWPAGFASRTDLVRPCLDRRLLRCIVEL